MDKILATNKPWIDEAWEKTVQKLRINSQTCKYKLPLKTQDGIYDDYGHEKPGWWTNGFWPGIMWLMYSATGEQCFRETAEIGEKSMDGALANFNGLYHDVGFMWFLSSGAGYKLTGSEDSKNRCLHAAAALASRFNINGRFIRAWNGSGFDGWVIIDCMLNIPLLYWAEKQTNNIAYKQIAMAHADTGLRDHIRPDGSVHHVLNYDIHTGECLGPAPFTQGYDYHNSSWSRGQSWAIYGYAMSYIYTGQQRYLDAAKQVAHYFIANVCTTGYVPMSDFRAPEEPVVYDTSAGAVAVCGLIEIAKAVPDLEKGMYIRAALQIMKALVDNHCDFTEKNQAILQNSSAFWNQDTNTNLIYGEYYFVEALYKLKGFQNLFW